jgi:hypothetical protein
MDINTFLNKMHDAGDAYVYYTTPVSKKTKYHICTIDLNSAQYIKDKDNQLPQLATQNSVRAFCWDLDTFKVLDVSLVTKVVPLNSVLKAPY